MSRPSPTTELPPDALAPPALPRAGPARRRRWFDPRRWAWHVWLGAIAPAAILLVTAVTPLDMAVASLVYDASRERPWFLHDAQPWRILYDLGEYPAWISAQLAILVLVVGLFWRRLRAWRRGATLVVLAVVLAPGLIVNGVLKPTWARPRPPNTVTFSPHRENATDFRYWWQPDPWETERFRSFSSGHAAAGCIMIAPAVLLRRRGRRIYAAAIGTAIGYGLLMAVGRVVQGRHWVSDVAASAMICYLVTVGLYAALLVRRPRATPRVEPIEQNARAISADFPDAASGEATGEADPETSSVTPGSGRRSGP